MAGTFAMPRRFQYSLRTLLIAMAICACGLFLWCSYPFGFIGVENATCGRPAKFNGRFVQAFGPPEINCHYELTYRGRRSIDFGDVVARRSALVFYRFEGELWPIESPGEYQI